MGFTGKNLEAANYLLREAALDESPRGRQLRRFGEAIVADSFLRLNMSPPVAEGFNLYDGRPVCAIGGSEVFLRSFGDDIKALLKAYERERRLGHDHPEWLKWCRQFADWLLTQQQPAGGFPRSWAPGNGQVVSSSPNASFNAVPLLVILHRITGQAKYLEAAQRSADFCWANGQCRGCFVGGTIDNPDIIDKEAGTLSVEAYLVHCSSRRRREHGSITPRLRLISWKPGSTAGMSPMPADEDAPRRLHWKRSADRRSATDRYRSFAGRCLHGIRRRRIRQALSVHGGPALSRRRPHSAAQYQNMLAMPGRLFDLGTPGWQQEHWSLQQRGYGLHRGWLPWVATSHLNGIFGVMELSHGLKEQLLNPSLEVHHDP